MCLTVDVYYAISISNHLFGSNNQVYNIDYIIEYNNIEIVEL